MLQGLPLSPCLGVGGKAYWGTVLGGRFHPVQDQSQGHLGACPGPSDAPHRRQLHISVIFDPLTRNAIGPLGTFHASLTSQSQPLAGTGTGGYRERELQAGSSSQYTHPHARRRKPRKTETLSTVVVTPFPATPLVGALKNFPLDRGYQGDDRPGGGRKFFLPRCVCCLGGDSTRKRSLC